MNRLSIGAIVVCVATTAPASFAIAAQDTALMQVAANLGYSYSYLGPEDAAALSRPGVTIVIRPGERLFDVNDRTEAMNGPAPRFALNDIFVSDSLVARLRQLASIYPSYQSVERTTVVTSSVPMARPADVKGAITDLTVAQIPGQQEIAVGGKAPANLPITLTLVGTFSKELPDVVLSRRIVTTDTNGTFKSDVSLASGYYRGAILTLVASSVAGIESATSQFEAKAPNAAVSVPADRLPRSIR
ncbi:MAG: hypothetical protein NVS3B17_15420 [Vulcanimicrobiaceae bacterium]